MPTYAKSHEEFLIIVCGICTLKSGSMQKITPAVQAMIEKLLENYDYDSWPKVVCKACVVTMKHIIEKGPSAATKKLSSIDYDEFWVPKRTRSEVQRCSCKWCVVGRLAGQEYLNYKASIKEIGRPRNVEVEKVEKENFKICSVCKQRIGKGIKHPCNKTSRNENLVSLAGSASPNGTGRVISKLLNKECEDQGINKKSETLTLPSGSRQLTISFGQKDAIPQWSCQDALKLQDELGLSDTQRDNVLSSVRSVLGQT